MIKGTYLYFFIKVKYIAKAVLNVFKNLAHRYFGSEKI